MRTRVTAVLGIEHPVLLAGMGPLTNVDLVAAVSEAGGLGILGATFLSAEEIHHCDAYERRQWWESKGSNYAGHWRNAGWRIETVDILGRLITFIRNAP